MTILHEPTAHAALKRRVQSLQPESARRWGKMSVDQMLWHVNESLRMALGDVVFEENAHATVAETRTSLAGAEHAMAEGSRPHLQGMLARKSYDFAAEQARCLRLIDQLVSVPLDSGAWPVNPTLGPMSGRQWSQLQAKHLEHHLVQFGV